MDKKKIAISALALAIVGMAILAVDNVAVSADLIAADDNEEPDEDMMGAGGGGWWKNAQVKNTFGFYLNSSDIGMSEFVLQARDVGVTVHALQFDSIEFNYDADLGTGSAEAWGTANVSGVEATFHLIVEDNGDRSLDRLMLSLSDGYDASWDVTGLGGGQIWVYLE